MKKNDVVLVDVFPLGPCLLQVSKIIGNPQYSDGLGLGYLVDTSHPEHQEDMKLRHTCGDPKLSLFEWMFNPVEAELVEEADDAE